VATVHAGTCAVVPKTAQSRSIEATTNMKILAVQAVVR